MPLLPVAHHAHWGLTRAGLERQPMRDHATCRHCGLPLHGWLVAGPDPDSGDSCPLCALPSRLDRPCIEQEAVLVWLPELSQRALVPIVRAAHLALYQAGLSPALDRPPGQPLADPALDALATLAALRDRSTEACARLGTASPRVLGAALLEAAAAGRGDPAFGAIRVLPLGRWIENGHDLYPQVLAAWVSSFPGS